MQRLSELEWEHVLIGLHVREKSSFMRELLTRLSHRVLPPYAEPDDARTFVGSERKTLKATIHKAYDTEEELPKRISNDARRAFDQLGAIANGEFENRPLYDRIQRLERTPPFVPRTTDDADYANHHEALDEMLSLLDEIRDSQSELGTSIELSYRTEKLVSDVLLLQKLLRMITDPDVDVQRDTLLEIVEETFHDQSILRFVERKLLSVFAEIISHNADTGEKYIASSPDEMRSYWVAALIGGVFVALFALLKLTIGKFGLPALSEAFVYGLNYAACFVFATLAGGTIATKQPAMTGHAFSRELTSDSEARVVWDLFRRLFTSQAVSLAGNVISVAILTTALWFAVIGPNQLDIKADYQLSRNAFSFSTVFYAAVAGVWLSLAGLMSGYFSNLLVYHRIAERVKFGGVSRAKIQKIAPKLFGSVVLGFLLGATGSIGELTGIPIDIRHVAFSSAQVTLGVIAEKKIAAGALLGVASIGIINLITSFLLTFGVSVLQRRATRSRISLDV